eukprot:359745-Pleurochrysis_carterae.AAC.1
MLLSSACVLLAPPRVRASAAVVATAKVKPFDRSYLTGSSVSSAHTQHCSLSNLVASAVCPQRHQVQLAHTPSASCLAAPRLTCTTKHSSMLMLGPLVELSHALRAPSWFFSGYGSKLRATFETTWASQSCLRTNSAFIRSRMTHAGILRAASTQIVPSRRSSVTMQLAALHGSPLPYRGVLIDFEKEACPLDAFEERLGASLDAWRAEVPGSNSRCALDIT